jgi:hypothetical protein
VPNIHDPSHRLIIDVIIRDDYRVGFEQVGEDTFVHVIVEASIAAEESKPTPPDWTQYDNRREISGSTSSRLLSPTSAFCSLLRASGASDL